MDDLTRRVRLLHARALRAERPREWTDGYLAALHDVAEHDPVSARELLSEATRLRLYEAAQEGRKGGRKSNVPDDVRRRIAAMRERGMTYAAIAAELDRAKVETAQGGRWRASTIAYIFSQIEGTLGGRDLRRRRGDKAAPSAKT